MAVAGAALMQMMSDRVPLPPQPPPANIEIIQRPNAARAPIAAARGQAQAIGNSRPLQIEDAARSERQDAVESALASSSQGLDTASPRAQEAARAGPESQDRTMPLARGQRAGGRDSDDDAHSALPRQHTRRSHCREQPRAARRPQRRQPEGVQKTRQKADSFGAQATGCGQRSVSGSTEADRAEAARCGGKLLDSFRRPVSASASTRGLDPVHVRAHFRISGWPLVSRVRGSQRHAL